MRLGDLLDQIRDFYMSRLTESLGEQSGDVIVEPALLNENGDFKLGGELNTPLRVDLVVCKEGDPDESMDVDTHNMISFEPFAFDWEQDLSVDMAPFQWNNCPILLSQKKNVDWHLISEWFAKWFQERSIEGSPFYNCVHFISDPETSEEGIKLYIDFGSAPVESFEELLDAIAQTRVAAVKIGGQ